MSWMPIGADEWARRRHFHGEEVLGSAVLPRWRKTGLLLRATFIVSLMIVIARVSMPQVSTMWTVYDEPGDLIRLVLGVVVCAWLGFQLFAVPRDRHAHGTWLYLGLAVIPFTVICIFEIW